MACQAGCYSPGAHTNIASSCLHGEGAAARSLLVSQCSMLRPTDPEHCYMQIVCWTSRLWPVTCATKPGAAHNSACVPTLSLGQRCLWGGDVSYALTHYYRAWSRTRQPGAYWSYLNVTSRDWLLLLTRYALLIHYPNQSSLQANMAVCRDTDGLYCGYLIMAEGAYDALKTPQVRPPSQQTSTTLAQL
jgi:hypothetical protein